MRKICNRLIIILFVFYSTNADANRWSIFSAGTQYCADSYAGHPNWNDWGVANSDWIVDINFPNDNNAPLYAPEDGFVEIVAEETVEGEGWGNSVIWRNLSGSEELHLAHLSEFGESGDVSAGEIIGRIGSTGF